jgi:hypothetical protein
MHVPAAVVVNHASGAAEPAASVDLFATLDEIFRAMKLGLDP